MQKQVPMLEIQNLNVAFRSKRKLIRIVRDFSLSIPLGKTHGLVGESGCGKSTVAYSIMRYLGRNGRILSGKIMLDGENLLSANRARLRELRGATMTMIYQEPTSSLNPSMKIIDQLAEVPILHSGLQKKEAQDVALSMLERVRIPDPLRISRAYPHQISGGQQQRIVIGMALLAEPKLLILDEPTTALDVTIEASILELVRELASTTKMSMLFISHNLGLIREICHDVTVMYAGRAVEIASSRQLFEDMHHPYSHDLLASIPLPNVSHEDRSLQAIEGSLPLPGEIIRGCEFAPRCRFAVSDLCRRQAIPMQSLPKNHQVRCARLKDINLRNVQNTTPTPRITPSETIVAQYQNVNKTYAVQSSWGGKRKIFATRDVSLEVKQSENLAIVGESGCGKTTLVKMLVGLETATGGQIKLFDENVAKIRLAKRRPDQRAGIQYIFQNPFDALNPSLTIGGQLRHIIRAYHPTWNRKDVEKELNRILKMVKMRPSHAKSYPRQLSGGQKQRIAIARAYAVQPKVVVADEPVSALDVSVQAAVMELFLSLQNQHHSTLILISHDLGVVRYLADRIIVMYLGQIVERGTNSEIFSPPYHPYTEALLASVPLADPSVQKRKVLLEGDIPAMTKKQSGCPFFSRCQAAMPGLCDVEKPPRRTFGQSHDIYCHIAPKELVKVDAVFHNAA